MASQKQPLEPSVKAKNLIQSFEKGEVVQEVDTITKEKPVSRPGATKKLLKEYEQKGREADPAPQKVAEDKKLKVFIVFAHWERKSYNGALLDTAVESLTSEGHTVEVSDLYKMKWNPVPSRNDFKGTLTNPDIVSWPKEAHNAATKGTLAPDIVAEHKKIMAADLVIFQFPMNWYGFPAILKGYIDRVWTPGFAYNEKPGDFFDKAKFKGKKAILSMTTGTPDSFYQPNSFSGDMNVYLLPLNNSLRFVGFDVLPPNIIYGPGISSDEQRKEALASWGQRSKRVIHETPLNFISIKNFNLATGGFLNDKYLTENTSAKDEYGLTVAQHMGKKLPENSMISSGKPSAPQEAVANGV